MFETQTFPCPNCNEIINDSARECRFCHAPIDPQAARAAGELQAKVNQACSDASYTKTAAYAMFVFLLLSFIPILPLVSWASLVTFVAVIVMVIRWQVKFGGLQTRDPDYKTAKLSRNVALILWIVSIPVWFVGNVVVGLLLNAVGG
ncbi:MAG TPA: hypothetical protein VN282_27480 [Pyrinomonadaceae bacterium]|nr:hypothetical protein [Pyrinomonadaceae bacterium]